MAEIVLTARQLTICHAQHQAAVIDQVDFQIYRGEIVCLLGPSGIGKSTLLSTLAGLHQPQAGQIVLLGRNIDQQKSQLAYMFQQAVLVPWLNVSENVAFGQNFSNQPKHSREQIQARVQHALARVKLAHLPHAKINTLSGGMAQRVALARALAKAPCLLLLDEPFSALDELNRAQLQQLLRELVHEQEIAAAMMITHDIDEALLIADRILFLSGHPAGISQIWCLDQAQPRNLWADDLSRIRQEILKQLDQQQTDAMANAKSNPHPNPKH